MPSDGFLIKIKAQDLLVYVSSNEYKNNIKFDASLYSSGRPQSPEKRTKFFTISLRVLSSITAMSVLPFIPLVSIKGNTSLVPGSMVSTY